MVGIANEDNKICQTVSYLDHHSLVNVCEREKILVKEVEKNEENESSTNVAQANPTRENAIKEIELSLTAPMITAWAYELAYGLHKGIILNV